MVTQLIYYSQTSHNVGPQIACHSDYINTECTGVYTCTIDMHALTTTYLMAESWESFYFMAR